MKASIYFLYHIVKNHRAYKGLTKVKQFESLPYVEKEKLKKDRLKNIIKWAYKNSSYYKRIFDRVGIIRQDDVNLNKFSNIPPLRKENIRIQNKELKVNLSYLSSSKNTSGGTTGEPVEIWQCKNYRRWARAYQDFYYQKAGYDYGKKLVRLWGSERDILFGSVGLKNKILNWIRNQKLLNTFKMSENDMDNFLRIINNFKPDVIEAYVQSIYELTKFIEEKKKNVYKPQGIIVTAGTLYDFMEGRIRNVFNTSIYNRYGSREVGAIACSCGGRKYLHISMLTHHVEVVDENNFPVYGKKGKILITSLTNFSMPLIRYEIGDLGIMFKNKVCPKCGWEGDVLEEIVGRTVDVFKNINGSLIDGEYFTHLFYFRPWVKKFQIIYKKNTNVININLVLKDGNNIPIQDKENIERAIIKVMKKVQIKWNIIPQISPDKSGKFRYTIMEE